jgi:hypothetical protein
MRKWTSWLAASCAVALALGANGCTTCGTNPEDETTAGESQGNAAGEELREDAWRDSNY